MSEFNFKKNNFNDEYKSLRPSPRFDGAMSFYVQLLASRKDLDITNYIQSVIKDKIDEGITSGSLPPAPELHLSDSEARAVLTSFLHSLFMSTHKIPAQLLSQVCNLAGVPIENLVDGVQAVQGINRNSENVDNDRFFFRKNAFNDHCDEDLLKGF